MRTTKRPPRGTLTSSLVTVVAAWCVLWPLLHFGSYPAAHALLASSPGVVRELTGTCSTATGSVDLGSYYNLNAIAQTNPGSLDVSSSAWDLGRDGAFVGYSMLYCEVAAFPGNTPSGVLSVVVEKGIQVTASCDFSLLAVNSSGQLPYHVLMFVDASSSDELTALQAEQVMTFFTSGGSLFVLASTCPSVSSANHLLRALPSPLSALQLHYSDNIYPAASLGNGNPQAPGQFGGHYAATGIPAMSSGTRLAVPIYNGAIASTGVFAPLMTVASNSVPTACIGETPAPSIAVPSHAGAAYMDPLIQLAASTAARSYGRIVVDFGLTRYLGVQGTRTSSFRFGANVVVWLINIERRFQVSSNATAGDTADGLQIIGCNPGDAVRLSIPASLACSMSFYPQTPTSPSCSTLLVLPGSHGTYCQLRFTANTGVFWIVMAGYNTTVRLVLTSFAFQRASLMSYSGSCQALPGNGLSLVNCTTGSSLVVRWLLPTPSSAFFSNGSVTAVTVPCQGFSYAPATQLVTCILGDTSRLPRGPQQLLIDSVPTDITVYFLTGNPPANAILCSISRTLSKTSTRGLSVSSTNSADLSRTADSQTTSFTSTLTVATSGSLTETSEVSLTASSRAVSVTLSNNIAASATATQTLTVTDTISVSATASAPSPSLSRSPPTRSTSLSGWLTETSTGSTTASVSLSDTWACVETAALQQALRPYAGRPPLIWTDAETIRAGQNITFWMYPIPHVESPPLHIPWFQPTECRLRVSRTSQLANQMGYLEYLHYSQNLTVRFVDGVAASTTLTRIFTQRPALVAMPPLLEFRIYEQEVVDLHVTVSCLTLGVICHSVYDNHTRSYIESDADCRMARLIVDPDPDPQRENAQVVMAVVGIVATVFAPHAGASVQSMAAVSLAPCSNSFQRVFLGLRRFLAPFAWAKAASWADVVWGQTLVLVVVQCLHAVLVVVAAMYRRVPVPGGMADVRFPQATIEFVYLPSFAGTVFGALQILSHSREYATRHVVMSCFALILYVLVYPVALFYFHRTQVNACFRWFHPARVPSGWRPQRHMDPVRARESRDDELHDEEEDDGGVGERVVFSSLPEVSLSSVRVLRWVSGRVCFPRGRWEPKRARRECGGVLELSCRPENQLLWWAALWLVPPLWVAFLAAVFPGNSRSFAVTAPGCYGIHSGQLVVFASRAIIVWRTRPLRSRLDELLLVVQDALHCVFHVLCMANLVSPHTRAGEVLLVVVGVVQVLLLGLQALHHNLQRWFVARELTACLPTTTEVELYALSALHNDVPPLFEEDVDVVVSEAGDADDDKDDTEKKREDGAPHRSQSSSSSSIDSIASSTAAAAAAILGSFSDSPRRDPAASGGRSEKSASAAQAPSTVNPSALVIGDLLAQIGLEDLDVRV